MPLYIDGAKAIYTAREVQIGDIKAVTDGRYNSINGTWESYDAYTQYRAHTTQQQETKDSATGETKQIYFDLINEIHLVKIEINKISPLGKAIDGVYSADPKLDPTATKYDEISYKDVLEQDLKVMDSTATSLCKDNNIPLQVFAISDPENIVRIIKGEKIGTVVE